MEKTKPESGVANDPVPIKARSPLIDPFQSHWPSSCSQIHQTCSPHCPSSPPLLDNPPSPIPKIFTWLDPSYLLSLNSNDTTGRPCLLLFLSYFYPITLLHCNVFFISPLSEMILCNYLFTCSLFLPLEFRPWESRDLVYLVCCCNSNAWNHA